METRATLVCGVVTFLLVYSVVVTRFKPSWRAPRELCVRVTLPLSYSTSDGQWDSCEAATEISAVKVCTVVPSTQSQTSVAEDALQLHCSTAAAAKTSQVVSEPTEVSQACERECEDEGEPG